VIRLAAVDKRPAQVVNKPLVVNKLVVNKPRSADRHKDPEARKLYQREWQRRRRAAAKAARAAT
jgi:hypothetical protein